MIYEKDKSKTIKPIFLANMLTTQLTCLQERSSKTILDGSRQQNEDEIM